MLDVKKMLTKLARMYVVEKVNLGSVELAAGGTGAAEGSVVKAGYTPIGIVGVYKEGGAHNTVVLSRWHLNSNGTVYIGLNNTASSARTAGNVTVSILYRLGA